MRTPILIACTLLAACSTRRSEPNEPQPAPDEPRVELLPVRTLRGVYRHAWEVQSFRPCGSGEQWWVGNAADLQPRAQRAGLNPDGPLLIEVRASVSERGRYGHMGAYTRQIGVQEVVRVEAAGGDSC